MKPSHIDAIHELARNDTSVRVFMHMKYQQHLQWDDVLAQMVLCLAGEKAALHKRLMDIAANGLPPIFIEGAATHQPAAHVSGDNETKEKM